MPSPENNKFNSTNKSREEYLNDLSIITKGAGITLGGAIFGKALLFFYTIFLARFLGASDFGLYFLGITIIGFLTILSNLGLIVGITRSVAIYKGRNDIQRIKGAVLSGVAITIPVSCVVVSLVFAFSNYFSNYIFNKPELSSVLKLLSLAIPFESLMWIFLASTRGLRLIHITVIVENIVWIALRVLLAVILLNLFSMGLNGILIAYIGSSIISAGAAAYFANKVIPLIDSSKPPIFEVKKILVFSVPMVFSSFLNSLLKQLDIVMLGIFVSIAMLGNYSAAVKLIVLAEVIFHSFVPIFNPFIAELHDQKELGKLSSLLKIITKWNITLGLPVFVFLFFFPEFFLNFFGKEFLTASSSLSIMVIAHLFSSITGIVNSLIFMSGRSDITLKNNIGILVINTGLNYFLIPKYGILGAAIATSISLVFLGLLRIFEANHLLQIHPFRLYQWKPLLSGLISTIIILSISYGNIFNQKITMMPTLIIVFIFTYVTLLLLFSFEEEELYLWNIVIIRLKTFSSFHSIRNLLRKNKFVK